MSLTYNEEEKMEKLEEFTKIHNEILRKQSKIEKIKKGKYNKKRKFSSTLFKSGVAAISSFPVLSFAIGGYNDFIRFAKNEEIQLAEELYTNTFAHNIYKDYGVVFTPDKTTLKQQLIDYSVTVNPSDATMWQEMGRTFESGLYSIALEYGTISNEIFLNTVFIAMGLCIATGITIGIYNNIRANKEKEEKIYELNEKIYNLEKKKQLIEQDLDAMEDGRRLLNQ